LTVDKPALGDGLDSSRLGATQRKDGSTQVTYKGAPLYYFLKDSAPGDTKGQGFQQIWHVLAPDGTVVTK
jgi:predicted lipoprotein with Yx(FWY)xxD motif